MAVEVGSAAPDFSLENQFGETVKLSDFRGKKAVSLVFYPLAFTGTCTGELCELRDNIAMFKDADVELLAISVNNKATLRVFAEQEGYDFSLLGDFWPHGEVAKDYGVFLEDRGIASRATFVIDRDGVIRASILNEPSQARALDAYREALAALPV